MWAASLNRDTHVPDWRHERAVISVCELKAVRQATAAVANFRTQKAFRLARAGWGPDINLPLSSITPKTSRRPGSPPSARSSRIHQRSRGVFFAAPRLRRGHARTCDFANRSFVVSGSRGSPGSLNNTPFTTIFATPSADKKQKAFPPPLKPAKMDCPPLVSGTTPTWGRPSAVEP